LNDQTKEELMKELIELRQRVDDFEKSDAERKRAMRKITHLNAVLSGIRNVNQLIVMEKDPGILLQGACDNLIENRDYHNAWIVILDESGRLVANAEAGLGDGFLPTLEWMKHDNLPDCGKKALRQSKVLVTENPSSTCINCSFADKHQGKGSMTVRLEYGGRICGLLSVSVPPELATSEEEQLLFHEVADDIALALHSIELGKKQKRVADMMKVKDNAISSTVNAITFLDMEGNVTYANPAFLRLWKYENDKEVLGKPFTSFWHSEKKALEVMKVLQDREIWSDELIAKKKDKSLLDVHLSANVISDKDGNPICIMASFMDTTRLNLLQSRLIQSERLAATGQLSASIAHEINSPLQAVIVMLSTIKDRHKENDNLLHDIDLLRGACDSIRGTVKSLLDLNRPGKEAKQSTNINNIIEDTVRLVRGQLKENKVRVNLHLSPRIPSFTSSPQQLGQVFLNLINNSIEAMAGTSRSKLPLQYQTLKSREINIKTNLRKGNVIINFSDTGSGIAEEDLRHIFDPFYTRKKKMGMGVGLSICHGIIEDHHGTIEVKNSLEGGAVFSLTLPLNHT